MYIDHRGYHRAEDRYMAEIDRMKSDIRQKTAEAQVAAIAAARDQEAEATRITNEVSYDYNARIAALRARYDSMLAKARTDQGSAGAIDLPGVPNASSGPDAAACQVGLSAEDGLIASIQAEQLFGLQTWVERQTGNAK